jgi:hypothetical protein
MDVHHQVDRLRIMKNLTPDESALIYLALNSAIEDYDQINLVFVQSNLTYSSFYLRFPLITGA